MKNFETFLIVFSIFGFIGCIELDKFEGNYLYRVNDGSDLHYSTCCKKYLILCGKSVRIKKEGEGLKLDSSSHTFLCKEMKGEGKGTVECAQLKENPALYINIDEDLRVYTPSEIGSRDSKEEICQSRLVKLDENSGNTDPENVVGSNDKEGGGGKKAVLAGNEELKSKLMNKVHEGRHSTHSAKITEEIKESIKRNIEKRYREPSLSHSSVNLRSKNIHSPSESQVKPSNNHISHISSAQTKLMPNWDSSRIMSIIDHYNKFSKSASFPLKSKGKSLKIRFLRKMKKNEQI